MHSRMGSLGTAADCPCSPKRCETIIAPRKTGVKHRLRLGQTAGRMQCPQADRLESGRKLHRPDLLREVPLHKLNRLLGQAVREQRYRWLQEASCLASKYGFETRDVGDGRRPQRSQNEFDGRQRIGSRSIPFIRASPPRSEVLRQLPAPRPSQHRSFPTCASNPTMRSEET